MRSPLAHFWASRNIFESSYLWISVSSQIALFRTYFTIQLCSKSMCYSPTGFNCLKSPNPTNTNPNCCLMWARTFRICSDAILTSSMKIYLMPLLFNSTTSLYPYGWSTGFTPNNLWIVIPFTTLHALCVGRAEINCLTASFFASISYAFCDISDLPVPARPIVKCPCSIYDSKPLSIVIPL